MPRKPETGASGRDSHQLHVMITKRTWRAIIARAKTRNIRPSQWVRDLIERTLARSSR
ncbi:MAG TPA: hypothetical protein VFJ24_08365 [Gaiellales bacterium]|nr:hypothetical protein [Gaiellales bacterium]